MPWDHSNNFIFYQSYCHSHSTDSSLLLWYSLYFVVVLLIHSIWFWIWEKSAVYLIKVQQKEWKCDLVPQCYIMSDRRRCWCWSYYTTATQSMPFVIVYRKIRHRLKIRGVLLNCVLKADCLRIDRLNTCLYLVWLAHLKLGVHVFFSSEAQQWR